VPALAVGPNIASEPFRLFKSRTKNHRRLLDSYS
jgi:hypothetical protein